MKKKHICGILAVAALLLCSMPGVAGEKAARECRQYTQKNCPARFDDNTILDSMTFDRATHTLHYYFTLAGTADSIGCSMKREATKALVSELHNTTMMRMYKEADYNFASSITHSDIPSCER